VNAALSVVEVQPVGLCGCGCGLPAPIAKYTCRRDGHVKGQPTRFIRNHHTRLARQDLTLFWEKVDKTTTPDGCWPWTECLDQDGYGRIWVNGRHRLAHQIALELVGFVRPFARLVVRHLCDNPPCCRPSHLRIDTQPANTADRDSKGRQARGEHNGRAKLRQQDVDEIRRLYAADGISQRALANQFNVHCTTIRDILSGKIWQHAA
jgi:hypothetical protein